MIAAETGWYLAIGLAVDMKLPRANQDRRLARRQVPPRETPIVLLIPYFPLTCHGNQTVPAQKYQLVTSCDGLISLISVLIWPIPLQETLIKIVFRNTFLSSPYYYLVICHTILTLTTEGSILQTSFCLCHVVLSFFFFLHSTSIRNLRSTATTLLDVE